MKKYYQTLSKDKKLEINNINHAFLKGSILSNCSFDNKTPIYKLGERTSNDIDILIARKISKSKAEKANILPFKEDEGKVYMLCEFHDENICKEMQFLYGCTISEVFINNEKLKYLKKD